MLPMSENHPLLNDRRLRSPPPPLESYLDSRSPPIHQPNPTKPMLHFEPNKAVTIQVEPMKQGDKVAQPSGSGKKGAPKLEATIATSRFAQGRKSRLEKIRPLAEEWTGRLTTFCTCNTFSLPDLFHYYLTKEGVTARRFSRDVVHIRIATTNGLFVPIVNSKPMVGSAGDNNLMDASEPNLKDFVDMNMARIHGVDDLITGVGDVFVFSYGVAVHIGLTEDREAQFVQEMKQFEIGTLEGDETEPEVLSFQYQYGSHTRLLTGEVVAELTEEQILEEKVFLIQKSKIELEMIKIPLILDNEFVLKIKLAYAHGAAQSGKLASFEDAMEGIFEKVGHLPVVLAETGRLNINDRELLKLSGELYTYTAYINLQTDILEVPDWFWDNEYLEPIYIKMAKYLDIANRTRVLSLRLTTLNEMYQLFRDERHLETGHRLEWIVIWLIVIEVLIDLFELGALFLGKS